MLKPQNHMYQTEIRRGRTDRKRMAGKCPASSVPILVVSSHEVPISALCVMARNIRYTLVQSSRKCHMSRNCLPCKPNGSVATALVLVPIGDSAPLSTNVSFTKSLTTRCCTSIKRTSRQLPQQSTFPLHLLQTPLRKLGSLSTVLHGT